MHCIEEQNDIHLLCLKYTHYIDFALAGYSYNVLSQFPMDDDLFVFVQTHVEMFFTLIISK